MGFCWYYSAINFSYESSNFAKERVSWIYLAYVMSNDNDAKLDDSLIIQDYPDVFS